MFNPGTVLIVGAGAGRSGRETKDDWGKVHIPFDFPLGSGLKESIATIVEPKPGPNQVLLRGRSYGHLESIVEHLIKETGFSNADLVQAAVVLKEGLRFAPSIDHFLQMRRDLPAIRAVAKQAIVLILLNCEGSCALFTQDGMTARSDLDGTWHQEFVQIAFQDVDLKNLDDALTRFSIISFNYDRCVEQVLRLAMMGLFSLTAGEAAHRLSNSLKIVYPYGSIGELPHKKADEELPFGLEWRRDGSLPCSGSIRTFTEAAEVDTLANIRAILTPANAVLFLGFGFHQQNMELLSGPIGKHAKVFGTAIGLSDMDRSEASASIMRTFKKTTGQPILEVDSDCAALIRKNRLSLLDSNQTNSRREKR